MKSEDLFEQFCTSRNLPLFRCVNPSVPTTEKRSKSADYILLAQGNPIVVEVKELNPNPQEKAFVQRLSDQGEQAGFTSEPGKRLRKTIDDAMPQLRETSLGLIPTLLVVFDNSGLPLTRLEPYEILTGMYGLEQVVFQVPKDPHEKPGVINHKFGPNQKVSPAHNTTLSAVAVLYQLRDSNQALELYHNDYAVHGIDPQWLRVNNCRQWNRESSNRGDSFREWMKL